MVKIFGRQVASVVYAAACSRPGSLSGKKVVRSKLAATKSPGTIIEFGIGIVISNRQGVDNNDDCLVAPIGLKPIGLSVPMIIHGTAEGVALQWNSTVCHRDVNDRSLQSATMNAHFRWKDPVSNQCVLQSI